MERYTRIAVPGAVVGLVLSILVALIAGVPFGVLILRGLLSGVVLGVGSVGVYVVAERLLPGLFDGESAIEGSDTLDSRSDLHEEEGDERQNRRVDIVLEDEEDDREPSRRAEKPEAAEFDDGDASDFRDAPGDAGSGVSDRGYDDDELVDEVEEQGGGSARELTHQAEEERKYGGGIEIDDAVLDEMPDIGAFSSTFSTSQDGEDDLPGSGSLDGFESSGGGGESRSLSSRASGMAGNDPATIAKALKTMLSRDEKE